MQINQVIRSAADALAKIDITSRYLDARILLSHATDKSLEQLILSADDTLSLKEYEYFITLLNRRLQFEPIAYIVGYKEFYSKKFKVNANVLIPRADTEVVIDAILKSAQSDANILDLGTGSGCIVLTLLLHIPLSRAVASDISTAALAVANENAKTFKLTDRVKFVHSDWFQHISANEKFDIIVSNPPYISRNEEEYMSYETITYEPRSSLFALNCGLDAYYKISKSAKKFLKQNGKLFVEIGFLQFAYVQKIFVDEKYILSDAYKDLAGNIRVLCFTQQ